MLQVQSPFQQLFDSAGSPLENGSIYVGTVNLNPETNPISVYWDDAATQPAAQPLKTSGGYIVRNGTPARIYTSNESYSITVKDKKGGIVFTALDATALSNLQSNLLAPSGSSIVGFIQAGVGAVARTAQDKMRDYVYGSDYGVIGDGIADDTTTLQTVLNTFKHVKIKAGQTPLISTTINVPAHTKLEFEGGLGNTSGSYPGSYLIKKSTMATPGISIASTGWVDGGGLVCQAGNTGDGVLLAGNSAKLSNFLVHGAGRDGVRVGTGIAGQNTNSCMLDHVTAQFNTRHGILLDDGTGAAGSNTNCITVVQPFCQVNGGDGIHIKEGFWNTLINPLCETNAGWGIYLSGVLNNGVPSCRQTQIIGGDCEANTLGQMWDGSYFSNWFGPASTPTLDPTGYYGNVFDRTGNIVRGLTSDGNAISANIIAGSVTQYPFVAEHRSVAAGGKGVGVKLKAPASVGVGNTSRDSGYIVSGQRIGVANNYDAMTFYVNVNGTMTPYLFLDPFFNFIGPATDNTLSSGQATVRWTTVYATTGAINTSDAREKQQVRNLSDQEKAVALRLKGMIKAFKFNDAVEAKGDGARIHVGVIAQEVKAAFEAEGLVAEHYAVLCYDEWPDEYVPEFKTVIEDVDGNKVETQVATGKQKLVRAAGNRYGVRHDQLFSFIISTL